MSDDFVIDINNMTPFTKGDGPIIIVDDDESQLFIVEVCYKKSQRKNKLICMLEGQEVLNYLAKVENGDMPMPELVLLDINMPKKTGFDILQEIRNNQSFRNIPIIVMFTTSGHITDQKRAQKLNANAFLSKPIDIEDYVKFFQEI